MNKLKWKLPKVGFSEEVKNLSSALNIPVEISQLLVNRGIKDYNAAKSFFRPQWSDLHDPFLMKDMQKAVDRISRALAENEKVMVYGDYDVDGTCSVALMYEFLTSLKADAAYYQPDRYQEGYGVSKIGIDKAIEDDVNLIIALDCGTKAIELVKYAKENGIDFIICDHHRPGEILPEAIALLNPKQDHCNYPFKELCGCGVGFKLVQAFGNLHGWDNEMYLPYLDLVALATGADIVSLLGENRILAHYGLKLINSNPRLGIAKMLENDKHNSHTISDIVFKVAPKINAAGRIAHANAAVELLIEKEESRVIEILEKIVQYNEERRALDKDITSEALAMIADSETTTSACSTVVYKENWHKGVLGIVASRLIETHYKPTIVLTILDGMATGSARSVHEFDVHKALSECENLLEKYGGHKYAAGLSIKEENLEAFCEAFETAVAHQISEHQKNAFINVELKISPEVLAPDQSSDFPKFYRILKQFAPFGPDNMSPTLLLSDMVDTGYSSVAGEEHLRLSLRHVDSGVLLNGIAFKLAEKKELLDKIMPIEIVCSLKSNHFKGRESMQLQVYDFRKMDD